MTKKNTNFQRTQWWWMKFLKNNEKQLKSTQSNLYNFITQIMRPDYNIKI
jgi:hypothetical protein